ncbi:hypothetical protein TRL7639_03243 [Falsiruegeria litorea R37]|uniref:Glycosyl transferase family 2 n=1 Tax=Falsiruegeria litorea R37 TaxID=1200284 RepID=A0A1Y5TC51_9RHOB|nr:glycosyltransferase family 2 protein [Falsiruegeria litorea]SLN58605.1 hypothetical protein TRL7639_03243 [Falsiruegeria litorea R37]
MVNSWSVFSQVRETRPVLERFVNHHLELGASYVHLFFDDPDDPSFAHFALQPGVIAERCGPQYWDGLNRRRPPYVERRQILNGRRAYEQCLTDWQAHVDADELIVSNAVPLGDALSRVPNGYQTAHMRTIEPMQSDVHPTVPFRLPIVHLKFRTRQHIYGPDLAHFKSGVFGHYQGKSFLRSGLPGWGHGIHFPRPTEDVTNVILRMTDVRVAHMHCENRELWADRTLGKIRHPQYNMRTGGFTYPLPSLQTDTPAEQIPDTILRDELLSFFDRMNVLSPDLQRRLEPYNLLEFHNVKVMA